ncbi:MAG: 16S rRNA (uracil(1498)-N(3))-methyltransferase [Bacteroidia bacterium]
MNIFIATINGTIAELRPDESWHCAKVLRYRAGDETELIDGNGNFYKGVLTDVHEKKCIVRITSGPVPQHPRNYYLHLAIAPTKQLDRIEWMIEKAVETGIDEITFLRCKNSERTIIKTERIQKIIESAVKQSLQAFIPRLNELCDFKTILDTNCDTKLIAHCSEGPKISLKELSPANKKILVLIGPEGDFTPEEVELALEKKFMALSLGKNRLRTETAGLQVCSAFALLS